jgi:NTP pyrophosphatase (non-canonical NTP hydrolase)
MDFSKYQAHALETDRTRQLSRDLADATILVPLLGLASEAGELLGEYKKHLRDGEAHVLFKERVAEELGDLLWYVANVASKFGLDLTAIAESNLKKTKGLWSGEAIERTVFDTDFPDIERLPSRFVVEIRDELRDGISTVITSIDGKQVGNCLTDNSYDPDGYRFHDVFHLSYAAILSWSPIVRKLLERKRKSNATIDRVEDGGRAAAIEEGISALVFSYARHHRYLEGVASVDYTLLRTIMGMTSHLEVGRCNAADWQRAIIVGYTVWRDVVKYGGGRIAVDLQSRTISLM